MANYSEGDLVKVSAQLTDPESSPTPNDPIDPTAVFLDYLPPGGPAVTLQFGVDPEITKDSTGVYRAELDTTGLPGVWKYRWYSTGTGQAADHGEFTVLANPAQ